VVPEAGIAIVGAGALGTLLASQLPRGGRPVRVLARRRERADALRAEAPGAVVASEPEALFPASLILLCVKAYQTDDVLRDLAGPWRASPAPVASLQNGWGHLEPIDAALPGVFLVAGATTLGAYWDEAGRYRTSTGGGTVFAAWNDGAAPAAADAARRFRDAGLAADVAANGRDVLWRKLVLNVAVNPLTALHGIPNGALRTTPHLWTLCLAAAREAVAVRVAAGHLAATYDPEPLVERLLRDTAANHSSMAQDLARGRRTEADAIVGSVARAGAAAGVGTPVIDSLATQLAGAEAARVRA
jgi:2-dehydropantoate 2-reductase